MKAMKLRLLLMGTIIATLGLIMLVVKGYSPALAGLTVVGIGLFVAGLLWR